ncbi:MAG: hypothetical protein RDU14_01115 [Melioribacteraceae bacterium]|nr:hypothetical protein [Melioribacteraceae bacterium]
MKKIDEKILRYFAGLMEAEEVMRFESQLKNDPELKERFVYLENRLTDLLSVHDIGVNDLYFDSIVPKLREKMTIKRKYSILKKYTLAIPIVSVILILFILTPFYDKEYIDQPVSLAYEIIKNINDDEIADNLINDYSLESALSFSENGNGLELYLPENVSLSFNTISPYVDISRLDYTQLENLSNAEYQQLYKNLSMITFEKVSK